MTQPVEYDVEGGVATITLNRPDSLNGLDSAMKVALLEAVRRASDDAGTRCVVVTGSGRAFSVGQDLHEHVEDLVSKSVEEVWSTVHEHYGPIAWGIASMEKPVVAAINGVAAGAGLSIACACDLRVAADSARFNTAFTGVGLSCDTGSSWTLQRLVGPAKAVELLWMPRTIDAAEALDLGIVTRVVRAASLAAEAASLAKALANGPTLAYAAVKQSVAFAASHSLEDALEFEATMMARTGGSADHRNAVQSFLAKEEPTFGGT